jgi:hypothetical protein
VFVSVGVLVFWVVTLCGVVGRYQCLELKMEAVCSFRTLVFTDKSAWVYIFRTIKDWQFNL